MLWRNTATCFMFVESNKIMLTFAKRQLCHHFHLHFFETTFLFVPCGLTKANHTVCYFYTAFLQTKGSSSNIIEKVAKRAKLTDPDLPLFLSHEQ